MENNRRMYWQRRERERERDFRKKFNIIRSIVKIRYNGENPSLSYGVLIGESTKLKSNQAFNLDSSVRSTGFSRVLALANFVSALIQMQLHVIASRVGFTGGCNPLRAI